MADRDETVLRTLRQLIAAVRAAPGSAEARGALQAAAGRHGAWDELAALLADEARAATRAEVAAAFWRELADVHLHQGRASDAEAAYRRLLAVAPGTLDPRDEAVLVGQLADVYETLTDQPLEAIAMVERLIELAPDDVALVDRLARLCGRVGAWAKAAAAFERIADMVPDDERAHAARRAAAAIQAAHATPSHAAHAWRAIVARWPGDVDAHRQLAALYAAEERWAELAEVQSALAGLVENDAERAVELRALARALAGAGDPRGALAALAEAEPLAPEDAETRFLRAELAAGAGNLAEAGALAAERLAAAPGDRRALDLAVRVADAGGDARAAAAARLARAAALPDGPDKVAALLDVAARLQGLGDAAGAAKVHEQVLALAPDQDASRRALDELRAAAAHATAVAAIRAELDAGRAAEAAARVALELAAFADAPAEQRGELVFLQALAADALGDADEGHRLLHEAHRLRRGDLRITIALGEGCFRRRLWHEAALHLSSLAKHPDAPRHAGAVAAALVHGAEAEIRALRPERAEPLWEAAVRLDPGNAAAWHALGERAMERGNLARAADCLEREAATTAAPADRIRLWDALGDLALDVLHDPARAERCFGEAARHVGVDPAHAPLLEKLMDLLRRRDAHAERAAACERLAELHPDPVVRRARLDEAIDAWEAAGEVGRARAAAARLANALPHDEAAVARASALELAAGDHDGAAARLEVALAAWEGAGPGAGRAGPAPRRAELWRRLGDARRAGGDARGAEAAYDRAVATAPESDAALHARRGLVELGAASGRPSMHHLRRLVEAEQRPAEVRALARALARAADAGMGEAHEARALYELAAALGAEPEDDDERFLGRHPARLMASDETYAGSLDDAEYRALVADPDDAPLADELDVLWEAAHELVAEPKVALAHIRLDAERLSPVSPSAAAALYPQVVKALAGPTTLLYATRAPGAPDVQLVLARPPVIVLGPGLVSRRAQSRSDVDEIGDAELRFRLGRVVELARPRRVLAAGAGAVAFARFVAALWHAFGPAPAAGVDPAVATEAERLRALPLRLRTRLAERLRGVAREEVDPMRFLAACERAADRAGLLACGHAGVAIAIAGGPAAAPHLVRVAASPRYLAARRKLRG